MKKYFVTIVILATAGHIFSQKKKSKDYENKILVIVSFSIGGSIPIHQYAAKHPADGLFNFGNANVYAQPISASFFGRHNLGVEAGLSVCNNGDIENQMVFKERLNRKYGSDYFVNSTINAGIDPNMNVTFLAGAVYKIILHRFLLVPKLMVGVNIYSPEDCYATLKEKDGNTIIDISYLPVHKTVAAFVVSPALTLTYRLRKRFAVNIDTRYLWSPGAGAFDEASNNYKTNEQTSIHYKANSVVQAIRIGAGVSILIGKR